MTFTLKDFDNLKKGFDIAVRTELVKYKKDKIEELEDPRKYQLLFLTSFLKEMEARAEGKKAREVKPFIVAFYGAMLLVTEDIKSNLGSFDTKSLLGASLLECMGITAENQPDSTQRADFYKTLNSVLKLIFVEHNSRNGLANKHALCEVPPNKLAALVARSYELEKDAQIAQLELLSKEGKTSSNISGFTHKDTPLCAVQQFKWEELSKSLETILIKERGEKNVAKNSDLGLKRGSQAQFLTDLDSCLSKLRYTELKDADKVAILAGAMYIVRGQIAQEYKRDPLYKRDSITSVIHVELTKLLKAKEESLENIEALVSAANHFIHHMTIEHVVVEANKETKRSEKDTFREAHMFSKIDGFNPLKVLCLAQNMINICRVGALEKCIKDRKAMEDEEAAKSAPAPAKGGILSSFTGFFKTGYTPVVVTEEYELGSEAIAASSPPAATTTIPGGPGGQ